MQRNQIAFLNPVLSIPWCFSPNAVTIRNVENSCNQNALESIYVDRKTGALDLRKKRHTAMVRSPKKLNKTISMLKVRQGLSKKNSSSTTIETSDSNNNSYTTETCSWSSIDSRYKGQEKYTKDRVCKKLDNLKSQEARNRRKTARPQKISFISENTDPLKVYNFEENHIATSKFCSMKFKKYAPRPKVGVVLKLRNKQYESTLL